MNKIYCTLALTLLLAPSAVAAGQEPDIIYVDGKPVYIGGLEPAADTQVKKTSVEEEIARTNVPGDIYRGTVLGAQTPTNKEDFFGRKEETYRGKVLGDHTTPSTEYEKRVPEVYRGKVFGEEQKKYEGDTLQNRDLAKTKFVYDTSLVRAIKSGDADRVRTLIYANVNVNERNYAGITPLTVAAEKGNLNIVKMLVEEGGAAVNLASSYGVTPLIAAAAAGQREVADYLIKNGANPAAKDDLGKTALLHAMAVNDRRLTETLVKLNNRAINLPDNMGNSPLIYAAQKGSLDNIRILLKYKVNPDYQNPSNGLSALAAAAAAGQEKAAQLLVRNGADINLKDHEGRTALFYAAENGQTALMRQLLRLGADVNIVDANGKNIFIAAAQAQSVPSLEMLSKEHFSINETDSKGKSALMYATAKDIQGVEWFIEKGADLNLQDQSGNTALMYAIKNLNSKAALLLLQQNVDLTAVNKEGQDAFALAAERMPNSAVMKVLQIKKHTVLQEQLKARAAQQALAQEEQARLAEEQARLAQEAQAAQEQKRQEIREQVEQEMQQQDEELLQLQTQLDEAKAQRKAQIQAQVEQEMLQKDEKLLQLQKQLDEAKAQREAQIQAQVDARYQAAQNAAD